MDTFEINEEDLYNASGAEVEEEPSSDNNIVAGDAALSLEGHEQQSSDDEVFASMEIGGNSGSQKSTTLNVVLEEDSEVVQAAEATSHHHRQYAPWGVPPRSSTRMHMMAQSLPVSASHIKMGSSVPINIPFLGAPRRAGKEAGGVAQHHPLPGTTFIPPHQLSQRDDFSQCLLGESPGCSMKRERLRVRNAILKSTGFLEQSAPSITAAAPGSIALAAVEDASLYQHSVLQTPARGGLAKALQESAGSEGMPSPA